jgi:hypothetical protein
MKTGMNLILLFILSFNYSSLRLAADESRNLKEDFGDVKKFAIVTYLSNNEQERAAIALIKSIRELSVNYSECKIYVILGDPDNFPGNSLDIPGVERLPLKIEKSFLDYPLVFKAFAAAQVEDLVKGEIETLTWLDPGVLVLGALDDLNLEKTYDVAVRPVSLVNNIGIPPQTEPDDYWKPIYRENRIDYKVVPEIESIVDEVKIQPYYNCEVYSFNPELGIAAEWARILTILLNDKDYQETACNTFMRRLFLHQAVLSGVITSKILPDRIKLLPIRSGYPFNQHEKLLPEKQVAFLNQLSVVIFDYTWVKNPAWMDKIDVKEPLRKWLSDTYLEYLNSAGTR